MGKSMQIFKQLRLLKKNTYPAKEICDLINQLRPIGFAYWTIPVGTEIIRARTNDDNKSFYSRCQLTYSPAHLNNKFGRAHIPKHTMFYGSLRPYQDINNLDPRFVPIQECIPWIRDKSTKGYKKVTFGRWIVMQEFNLAAIIQNEDYINNNLFIQELLKKVKWDEEVQNEKALKYCQSIAEEYANIDTQNDYDYMVTAYFSQYFINAEADGILYPSVRFQGQVLNVAIPPVIADTRIQLREVFECSVYKNYDQVFIANDFFAELYPDQTFFTLSEFSGIDHLDPIFCLNRIGLRSMDELIN